MSKQDWCTSFPEHWVNWKFQKVYIGDICKDHDDVEDKRGGCDSTKFAKGLWKRKVMLGLPIFLGASIACWVKYPLNMFKRI